MSRQSAQLRLIIDLAKRDGRKLNMRRIADELNANPKTIWSIAHKMGYRVSEYPKPRSLLLDAQQGRANASERSRTSQRSGKGV